jgi:UDP-GlcNAc:undecaprenyl-phosphate GlcNAc-1-phosphate transferase
MSFCLFIIIIILLNFFLIKNNIIKNFLLDFPDKKRKFHKKPIPLIGGLIVIINISILIIFLFIVFNKSFDIALLIGIILFFFSGLIDDKYKIRPLSKILLIIGSCSIIYLNNPDILNIEFIRFSNELFSIKKEFQFLISVFCILLLINASNMMDGINGIAITFFIIIFVFLSQFILENFLYFYTLIFLITVLLMLLILNLKNKLFLGDSGVNVLVFFSAFLIIFIHKTQLISLDRRYLLAEDIFILLIIPGIDMLRIFIKRIYTRKSPFHSDANHLHHILLRKFKNSKITYIIYTLSLVTPILLNYLFVNKQIYIIIITIIIYTFFVVSNEYQYQKN